MTIKRDDEMTLGGALVGPSDAQVGAVLRQGAARPAATGSPWADIVARHTASPRAVVRTDEAAGSSPGRGLT